MSLSNLSGLLLRAQVCKHAAERSVFQSTLKGICRSIQQHTAQYYIGGLSVDERSTGSCHINKCATDTDLLIAMLSAWSCLLDGASMSRMSCTLSAKLNSCLFKREMCKVHKVLGHILQLAKGCSQCRNSRAGGEA